MHQPKVLVVQTFYPEFLASIYAAQPQLASADSSVQTRVLLASGFSTGDAYSHELRRLGCETWEIICNADAAQAAWAHEHDLPLHSDPHERRRQIVHTQIRSFRPDVVYVFEWCPLGDRFWCEVRQSGSFVIGEIASPLPPDRTFSGHSLMVSSLPPIVEHFRSQGRPAEFLRLGFDARTLERLPNRAPCHDASFVGGFAPSHPDRIRWLEEILNAVDVDVFCYGLEQTRPDSPVRRAYRGQAWGRSMYEVLHRSRLTLNRHARIEVDGVANTDWCNNLRMYETTGVGACLVTEWRPRLGDLFVPDVEVVTYRNTEECIEKLRYYLRHENERAVIAQAGQRRTLAEHTFAHRMHELLDVLARYDGRSQVARTARRPTAVSAP